MKIIDSAYISKFLPIQELDEIKPIGPGIANIGPNDLLLMSQISAYATNDANAVAVSKKINYKNFSEKLSDTFSIAPIKLSIHNLSSVLSNSNEKIDQISAAVRLSVNVLSTYSNTLCSNLSTTIQHDYIAKYGEQTCALIEHTGSSPNPTTIASSLTLSDGQIIDIKRIDISNIVIPEDWKIAYAGIASDILSTSGIKTIAGSNSFEIPVLSDCYLNCRISAVEDDSYGPLEVWITTKLHNKAESSSLYEVLNNPGGFSGNDFTNYYHFAIPTKAAYDYAQPNYPTKITVKYQNASNTFKDGSAYCLDMYYYYAVTAKDDLIDYVTKDDESKLPSTAAQFVNKKHVYDFKFNGNGLVVDATSVYFGPATNGINDLGLIKAIKQPSPNAGPQYFTSLSTNNVAYTEVPRATNSIYGTIKTHSTKYGNYAINELSCGLSVDRNGQAYIKAPSASNNTYGVVKTNATKYSNGDNPGDTYSYLQLSSNGVGYVVLPKATANMPGVIGTGTPDTTKVRIVRSVYIDKDGIAKVNVATPLGVGIFKTETDKGYDYDIELELSGLESSAGSTALDFAGQSVKYSDYGECAISCTREINGSFIAMLLYEGKSRSTISDNDYLQIVCDNRIVTTLHPKNMMTAADKLFQYVKFIGLFGTSDEDKKSRTFAVISNKANFTYTNSDSGEEVVDKLHFLIKEVNNI